MSVAQCNQFGVRHDQLIYQNKDPERKMRVVLGGSGEGSTIRALLEYERRERPNWVIQALFTATFAKSNTPSKISQIGREYEIPVISLEKSYGEFSKEERAQDASLSAEKIRVLFHNIILQKLNDLKVECDLVGLAGYMLIVPDEFIKHFNHAVINSHPADPQKYKGKNAVLDALSSGEKGSYTVIHCVTSKMDEGLELVRGKFVPYTGGDPVTEEKANAHQQKQKLKSDFPAYIEALNAIAAGKLGFHGPLYHAQEGFVNLDSARQSKIEAKRPNEEDHSRIGKADEKDRFGKAAASPNSQNVTECGKINMENYV